MIEQFKNYLVIGSAGLPVSRGNGIIAAGVAIDANDKLTDKDLVAAIIPYSNEKESNNAQLKHYNWSSVLNCSYLYISRAGWHQLPDIIVDSSFVRIDFYILKWTKRVLASVRADVFECQRSDAHALTIYSHLPAIHSQGAL